MESDDRPALEPAHTDVGLIARRVLDAGDLVALRALLDRLEEAAGVSPERAVQRRRLLGLVADLAADARELERQRELAEWTEDDAYGRQVSAHLRTIRRRHWHRFRVRVERLFWHDLYGLDSTLTFVGAIVVPHELRPPAGILDDGEA